MGNTQQGLEGRVLPEDFKELVIVPIIKKI